MENNANVNETAVVFKERLGKLMDWNGVSARELAESCDVNVATINKIFAELHLPRVETVSKIADFFMVSVDWLLGRVDELDEILSKEIFNATRVLSYEAYLTHERNVYPVSDGYLSPWPYNLAEEMLGPDVIDGPLSDDQATGLDYVLNNTLTDRTREMILMRYKGEMTLEEIGKEYNLGKERVRQIIARGVRMLRHPSRTKYLLNGYSGEKTRQESVDKRREYDMLCAQLGAAIEEKTRLLGLENEELERLTRGEYVQNAYGHSILELDLSVRAHNCLVRAGLDTIGDVVGLISRNSDAVAVCGETPEGVLFYSLMKIRNMGKHSAQEVIDKLKERGLLASAA